MEIKYFEHELYGRVRVYIHQDFEPWFVARDVCAILGIANASDALADLSESKKGIAISDTPGGRQRLLTVNEAGLYNLIFKSRKPEALAFQDWVCSVVLPSLRKHGAYVKGELLEDLLKDPAHYATVLNTLAEERKRGEEARRRSAELEDTNRILRDAYWSNTSQIAFANTWNRQGRSITIEQMGRVIHQQAGRGPGERELFRWLRDNGWLCKGKGNRTQPTQWAIDKGMLKTIRHEYKYARHGSRYYWRTYVTPKGQRHLLYVFLDNRLC